MKIRAKNGEQTVDITLPATDMDIQYCMKCIGIEDIVPVCCISEVRDEPSYFGFLKGQTVNMDELNFLARRLDGMTEYEKRVVGVYSSETGIREMKQLINLTYSLQGLSLQQKLSPQQIQMIKLLELPTMQLAQQKYLDTGTGLFLISIQTRRENFRTQTR